MNITLPGSIQSKNGVIGMIRNEDTVFFRKKKLNDFIELKDLINKYIKLAKENKKETSQIESVEVLEKLAQLKDKGILTVEEFNNKKKELLDRI